MTIDRRFVRRLLVFAALLGVAGASPHVEALGKPRLQKCSAKDFDKLASTEKVFVAWFYATWCPTCQQQRKALQKLSGERIKGSPMICQFDFDSTEALQGRLGVKRQSTLVRFRKGTETSRSVGEKDADRLKRFLEGL